MSFIKHGKSLPCVLDLQLLQVVLVVQLDPNKKEGKRKLFKKNYLFVFSPKDVMYVIENIKILVKDLLVSH